MTDHENVPPSDIDVDPAPEGESPQPAAARRAWPWIVAGAILIALGAATYFWWMRPLAPRLESQGSSASADESARPQCGGPPVMTILLIGNDTEGYQGDWDDKYTNPLRGTADAIRVVRVNFVDATVTMLAVPRDLWVPIPQVDSELGVPANRLKTAYAYGVQHGFYGGGAGLVAATLEQNFELSADRYVVVSIGAFETGIDAIGGIEVDLPHDIDIDDDGEPEYTAGANHLTGAEAVAVARARPGSDLARLDRQNLLIRSLQEKILAPEFIPQIPDVIRSVQDLVLTDLSPSEISKLICIAERMGSTGEIATAEIGRGQFTVIEDELGYERFLPDYEAISSTVEQFEQGELGPDS